MTSTEVLASNGQGILLTWAVQNQIQVSFPQVYPTSPSNAAPRPQGHPKLHHSDNSGSYITVRSQMEFPSVWYDIKCRQATIHLRHLRVSCEDLADIFSTYIRSSLEYASPVWSTSISRTVILQSEESAETCLLYYPWIRTVVWNHSFLSRV